MAISPEIKNFTKNTLIFTLFFTLVIHLSWGYIMSLLGFSAKAQNEKSFDQANVVYIGNIATALSLNLGGASSQANTGQNALSPTVISMSEVMSNPTVGQQKLIASNMIAITAYANILKTDLTAELNSTNDRATAIDRYTSLLKSYHIKTEDQLSIIRDQKKELQAIINDATARENEAKKTLDTSSAALEYAGVDNAIDAFVRARNTNTRAKVYMVYLDRFEQSYTVLQKKNVAILDAVLNNRTALVKNATVVIPSAGTDIVKEL